MPRQEKKLMRRRIINAYLSSVISISLVLLLTGIAALLVINAGSVFMGKYACESAGDYASGTNHTLPTHQYALAYSGVNLDTYNRKVTFQHLTEDGIRSIGKAVVCMAEGEQLEAHANAMRVRIQSLKK